MINNILLVQYILLVISYLVNHRDIRWEASWLCLHASVHVDLLSDRRTTQRNALSHGLHGHCGEFDSLSPLYLPVMSSNLWIVIQDLQKCMSGTMKFIVPLIWMNDMNEPTRLISSTDKNLKPKKSLTIIIRYCSSLMSNLKCRNEPYTLNNT